MMYSTGITPEATAHMIEAIANDKAARIKAVSRSAVVMVATPEWVRAEEALACFGLPPNQLKSMVISGAVKAKKLDRLMKRSAVIYKVADIRKAIEGLPDYREWLNERPDMATTTKQGENENE